MAKKVKINRTAVKEKNLKIWSLLIRARNKNRCEICGCSGILNAHHIITKKFLAFAFNVSNGVCLCPTHHRFSNEIAPHSDNSEAVENWMEWLHASSHGEWYREHKHKTSGTIYDTELLDIQYDLLETLAKELGTDPTLSACQKKFKYIYNKG